MEVIENISNMWKKISKWTDELFLTPIGQLHLSVSQNRPVWLVTCFIKFWGNPCYILSAHPHCHHFPPSAFVHLISSSDHTDSLKLPQQASGRPSFTIGTKIFRLSGVELPYDEYRDQSEMETVNYHMLFKPAVEQWLRAARKKSYARIKKAVELDKVRDLINASY